MLNETLIKEFQDIFLEEYDFEIKHDDAVKAAAWLATYFDVLAEAKQDVKEEGLEERVGGTREPPLDAY